MKSNYLQEVVISLQKNRHVNARDFNIFSSQDTAEICRDIIGDSIDVYESFIALYINISGKVVGWHRISSGGITGAHVDIRLLFSAALQCLATKLIICHNHPSGNFKPSDTDIKFTKQVKEAGRLLWIELMDHVIVCSESYYSFADEGIL